MGFVIEQRPYPPDIARDETDPRVLTEICGDRAGLIALRDLIDRAIEEGESFVSDRTPNTINVGACCAVMREDGWDSESGWRSFDMLERGHETSVSA